MDIRRITQNIKENIAYNINIVPIVPSEPRIPKISKYDNIKIYKQAVGKTLSRIPKYKKGTIIDINIQKKYVTILSPKNNKTYQLNIDTVKIID